ncbi:OmpA family protein [Desulfotalea psychrophila]|nr:OmpA family protein [Desulfotalea psychrophila]
MQRKLLLTAVVSLIWSMPALAVGPAFVESADEMVEQMLGGRESRQAEGFVVGGEDNSSRTRGFVVGGDQGLTRSFTVVEPKTRAIKVRAKKGGQEQTIVVQVGIGLDPAARLKVEFDLNSARLRRSAYPLLAELARALEDERVVEHQVCIKGHTDSAGAGSYNLQLSYSRANAVRDYLAGAGMSVDKLEVFGYGENMPLVTNSSEANRQLNRRVEVSLNCPEIN